MATQAARLATPGSRDELAAELSAAAEAGETVRVRGAGTKLTWAGLSGFEPGLELSTTGLDTLVEHNAGDLTAILEAGVPLARAQSAFAEAGQMLALDPPDGGATVGGIVASADSGPLRSRYGGVRDLVVGMHVALSDGTRAKTGGKVIKNVAGYDLAKLFAGSFGTLGAIIEVAVRLHPLPPSTATAIGRTRDAAMLAEAAAVLTHASIEHSGLDVRWEDGAGSVLARFGGAAPGPQAENAARLLREAGLDTDLAEEDDGLWSAQRDDQRPRQGSSDTVVRVAGVQTDLPAAARRRHAPLGAAGRPRPARPLLAAAGGSRGCARRAPRHPRVSRRAVVLDAPARGARARGRVGRARRSGARAHAQGQGRLRPQRRLRAGGARMSAFDETRPPSLDLIDDCVHCGFCLPTCPTYRLWGEEMDSPRGRIVLMKQGHEQISAPLVEHIDNCLGLHGLRDRLPVRRAVRQADRGHARPGGAQREAPAARARLSPARVRALHPSRAAARGGARDRARAAARPHEAGRAPWARAAAPKLSTLLALSPDASARRALRRLPERFEARGERRGTVALLQGCVQRVFFGHVNEATARVLAAEGFEVHVPRLPRCCGALQLHAGDGRARAACAKDTIEALEGYDTIVVELRRLRLGDEGLRARAARRARNGPSAPSASPPRCAT